MAFVYRAGRSSSLANNNSTPETVGPGSYQAPSSVKQARPSLAPFSTTATRGFEADTGRRSVSPGRASSPSGSARNGSAPRSRPDQAAADGGSSGAGTSTPSLFGKPQRHFYAPATSSFAGEADRFGSSATASPGPAYKTELAWGKKQLSLAPAAAALTLTRPTPPSIPCLHDSFGYEPSTDGHLVKQGPPAVSGQAADVAQRPATAAAAKGPAWSKSKAPQHPSGPAAAAGSSRAEEATPGPGSYDLSSSGAGHVGTDGRGWRRVRAPASAGVSASGSGSSAFASKTLRPHQRNVDQAVAGPGPGSYTPDISPPDGKRPATAPLQGTGCYMPWRQAPVAPGQQQWSRASGRDTGPGAFSSSSSKANMPGPGSYSPGASVDAYRHQQQQQSRAAAKGSSVFKSESDRFGGSSSSSAGPGPGDYPSDVVTSLSHQVQTRASTSCTKGAFGSATSRFAKQQAAAAASGRGSLGAAQAAVAAVLGANGSQPRSGMETAAARKAQAEEQRKHAVFASQSTRFRSPSAPIAKPDYSCWDNSPESLKGDVTRLGPGSYIRLDDWGAKQQRGHGPRSTTGTAFGSSNKQAHVSLTRPNAAIVPGPGAYEGGTDLKKVFTPLSRPDASQAGFCSAQGRFKQTAAGTPGPGSYTPGAITRGASSSLATAQKTYNVTYLGMQ